MNVAQPLTFEMPDGSKVEASVFQLLQWKHAIGLEMKGLRHSRGSVAQHVRKHFNMLNTVKRQEIIDFLESLLQLVRDNG